MKREGFIIPYTYHCMAMSCFSDVLEEELGNDWRWAQLLPNHFDVCDPKGTPMFHEGIHVPCYCLPSLWPVISCRGTEDDLKRCKVILLFAKKSRCKAGSLVGFIEIEEIKGPFYIKEDRRSKKCPCVKDKIDKIDEESPCVKRYCPNLNRETGSCRKGRPRGFSPKASVYVMYKSVHIIYPEAVKDKTNPLGRGWWNHVKERQNELLEMYEKAKENTREVKPPKEWCLPIENMARALHKHGILRYLYNRERIRKVWRFAGILKIVEDTLRGAGRSI